MYANSIESPNDECNPMLVVPLILKGKPKALHIRLGHYYGVIRKKRKGKQCTHKLFLIKDEHTANIRILALFPNYSSVYTRVFETIMMIYFRTLPTDPVNDWCPASTQEFDELRFIKIYLPCPSVECSNWFKSRCFDQSKP